MLTVVVYGNPAPQGSKAVKRNKHSGKIAMVESSKKVKPWRESVKWAAIEAIAALDHPGMWRPFNCPLLVDMIFTFNRPKGHWRTGRNAHLLRESAPWYPAGYPDLSKLARSTEDALTDAGVWADDGRVVKYGRLEKLYANSISALRSPGALIRVRPMPDLAIPDTPSRDAESAPSPDVRVVPGPAPQPPLG